MCSGEVRPRVTSTTAGGIGEGIGEKKGRIFQWWPRMTVNVMRVFYQKDGNNPLIQNTDFFAIQIK